MSCLSIRLETDRLLLRPPLLKDFEGWAALMGDEQSARHIGGVQPRSVAFRGLLAMAGAWQLQGFGMFSVIERASGRWLGRIGPWQPEGWPGTEVGWGLRREAWGQGFAPEAARAAIDWAFDQLGWDEVIHCITPDNHASQAVARKLGSARRGPGQLPPPFEHENTEIWGQTREAWKHRRG